MRYKHYRRARHWGWRARLLTFFALLIALFVAATAYLRPIVLQYAQNLVQYTATAAINAAVEDKVYSNRAQYESLVHLERDNERRVTALKTDSIAINRIKTEIVSTVYEGVNTLEQTTISIPLGTILAPSYCAGMGPNVRIGIAGLGFASAEFASAFSQAGINQTRHNIVLEVHADVSVLTAFGNEKTAVDSSFQVTDTVIVGSVPDQYTYIDDTEQSLLGKVNDYAEPITKASKSK